MEYENHERMRDINLCGRTKRRDIRCSMYALVKTEKLSTFTLNCCTINPEAKRAGKSRLVIFFACCNLTT